MIDPRFVWLGALLSIGGGSRYAWLTWRGRTRPNRVTWFLWGAAPIIGFLAQLDEGVGLPAVLTASIGIGPLLIFAASFTNAAAYWRLTRFDLACGGVSVLALVVWLGLDDPVAAIAIAVLADAVAGIPTIRKCWTHPDSENPVVYVLGGLNGTIALLTLDRWVLAEAAFPTYIAVLGMGLSAVVLSRGRRVAAPAA